MPKSQQIEENSETDSQHNSKNDSQHQNPIVETIVNTKPDSRNDSKIDSCLPPGLQTDTHTHYGSLCRSDKGMVVLTMGAIVLLVTRVYFKFKQRGKPKAPWEY